MRFGDKLDQIVIPCLVFWEKNKTCLGFVNAMLFVVPRAWRQEEINPDDGLDAGGFAFFVELYCAVKIAVIRERECLLIVGLCRCDKFGYFGKCLEKRIVTVCVQMDKISCRTRLH